jgi:hypothetical protein
MSEDLRKCAQLINGNTITQLKNQYTCYNKKIYNNDWKYENEII